MIRTTIIRLRLKDPVRYKFPFIISSILLVADLASITLMQFISLFIASLVLMVGFAGFGYLTNDWADMEKDALVNKPNSLAGSTAIQRTGLLVLFVLMIGLPWFVLPFNVISALFVIMEIFLFVSYAFPPLRLKERGWLGIAADAGYAHILPVLFAAYTFWLAASLNHISIVGLMLILGIWQAVVGVRNILLHQLQDAESDRKSGTRTFMFNTARIQDTELFLQRYLIPAEAISFTLFCLFTISNRQPLVVLSFILFITLQCFYKKLKVNASDYRKFLYIYADPYYSSWLPASLFFTYLFHLAERYVSLNL